MAQTKIPTVNFRTARQTLVAAARANVAVMLLGDPGIGKSALVELVGADLSMGVETMLGSTLDPTDIGGVMYINPKTGQVERQPIEEIRAAIQAGRILFCDEASAATHAVQAAMLRLILERKAGPHVLHKDTRVMLAANPPEQAPGGFELSAPLMGRVVALALRPTEQEVLEFFKSSVGDPDGDVFQKAMKSEALDFALTAQFNGDLLQIDIPKSAVEGGEPWGAPRAWERTVKARAAASLTGAGQEAVHALTAGNVGQNAAIAYEGVLKLRKHLPSIDVILADPMKAAVPEDKKIQIAALGLTARVADQNTWAAWIYASRLVPEFGTACMATLMQKKDSPTDAPHAKEGRKIRVTMAGKLLSAMMPGT